MTSFGKYFAFSVLVFVMCIHPVFAQETIIKGYAEGRPDALVRVVVYADQFSHLEYALATTYTDEDGKFEMKINIPETTFAYLALELKKGEFYIKPGAEYDFKIPLDTTTSRGSVFDELPLQFNCKANDGGLIENIGKFNLEYNTFILNNTNRIYRSRDKSLIAEFKAAIQTEFQNADDQYLNDYIRYTMASLEWVSKAKSEEEIMKEYFLGQTVLYQNIQYTDFFAEFFKAAFASTDLFGYNDLVAVINSDKGYIDLDNLLLKSEALANDTEIRELVATLLIAKKYYSPNVIKRKVIEKYRELQRNSKFSGVRKTAEDYIEKLTHHANGSPATPFKLTDADGNDIELSSFKGKFVLLNFNRADCKMCLHYFQDLDEINKEFKGKLEIVSIVKDDGFVVTATYAGDRSFDWTFLNLGRNILLLEDYHIRTFPAFVIINPENNIVMETAPLPGEGLNLYIRRFMSEYAKKQAAGAEN